MNEKKKLEDRIPPGIRVRGKVGSLVVQGTSAAQANAGTPADPRRQIRTQPPIVQPQTPGQLARWAAMGEVNAAWKALTENEKDIYRKEAKRTNRWGGWQLYCSLNLGGGGMAQFIPDITSFPININLPHFLEWDPAIPPGFTCGAVSPSWNESTKKVLAGRLDAYRAISNIIAIKYDGVYAMNFEAVGTFSNGDTISNNIYDLTTIISTAKQTEAQESAYIFANRQIREDRHFMHGAEWLARLQANDVIQVTITARNWGPFSTPNPSTETLDITTGYGGVDTIFEIWRVAD